MASWPREAIACYATIGFLLPILETIVPINHKIILPLLLSLAILLIPTHWIPLEGITVVEQRVVAIFVLAALCWILEPIPIFATSGLIVGLELLLLLG